MKAKILLFFLFFIFSVTGVIAQNNSLECQYQETIDTGKMQSVLYDKEGNSYSNPIEFTNFVSGQGRGFPCSCKTSFDIKNNIDKKISLTLFYQVGGYGQNAETTQKNTTTELGPFSKQMIVEDVPGGTGLGGCGGCGISSNIQYNFIPNDEVIAKSEKIYQDICKQCNGKVCLNDGEKCSSDFECGSEICNIAGYCGIQQIVDCPQGFQNCNNETCLEVGTKKTEESYFCEFECKSNHGEKGVCKLTLKNKFLRILFFIFALVILIGIVYIIWTNKSIRGLKWYQKQKEENSEN